ncbi:MAG: endonuclease/exonuclease/phosphatase family protein [Pseudomonadota bacterium]
MIARLTSLPAAALCVLSTGCATLAPDTARVVDKTAAQCERLSASRALPTDDLRLTTWNVYKGAVSGWQGELGALASPNGVFLMQEALVGDDLMHALGAEQRWHFSPGYQTAAGSTGVLTTAAVNAIERCVLHHREPWLRSPKASLVTRYRLEGTSATLLVANVHAINFTFGTRAYARQLNDIVALLEAHEGPMIFAGDFNTWSRRRQRVLDGALAGLGLTPVAYKASRLKRAFGNPLDHVYYRGLNLREARAYPTSASDHSRLTASFAMPVAL